MKRRWKQLHDIPGELRFFEDLKHPGRVAVADGSGATPELTDDRVWWVDKTRPITCESPPGDDVDGPWMGHWSIPLVAPDGRVSSTPHMARSVDALAQALGMSIDLESESTRDDEQPHVVLGED